jgi:CRISPR/Cas system-associated exonuclease Cas4 (RecB family)
MSAPRDEPRSSPYFWVTWLPALLSGDSHCRYAAWYKGHFKYAKVPQPPGDEERMRGHMQVHEEGLAVEAARLDRLGMKTSIEDANAFTVRGKRADVGGKIDLVSHRDEQGEVVDIKGGRRYDKHVWQVIFYMAFGVARVPGISHLAGKLSGRGDVLVTPKQAEDAKPKYVALITDLAASTPPPAAPSPRECQFCDILLCEFRYNADQHEPDAAPPGF